jgi:signal transduction histidine kinase/CheY-like chemotaxis protein
MCRSWLFPRPHWTVKVFVVAILYYGAAGLSLRLALEKTNASPVWPPSGIALAAVVLLGYGVWPGIMLGAFLANVVTFLANQAASAVTIVVVSSAICIGNTAEALVGALLLRRLVGARNPFDRARDVFTFTAVALVASAVAASVGPTSVSLAGIAPLPVYGTVWLTWWLGDTTGILLVAPLLLTWKSEPLTQWRLRRSVEIGLLFVSLLAACRIGSAGWLPGQAASSPLIFVPIPWLVWAAFRFGPREAAAAAAVTSWVAIWATIHGIGPFVGDTVNESLLLLQAFVGVVTVTILAMAALVAERREVAARLRTAHDTLETRVEERTRELVEVNERLQGEIADRKRTEETLRQTEKLAAMGAVLAGVAHELSNPLSVVTGQTLLLRGAVGSGPLAGRAEKIVRAAERCARIVRNFLALTRQHPPERREVRLNQVLQEAVDWLEYSLRVDSVEVGLDLAPDLPVLWADPYQLQQVVVNLITNAHQAMRERRGPRWLTLTTRQDLGAARVLLEVADTGPGIPAELHTRIFEPFFTTKAPGHGTGLGLPLCRRIIEAHGGTIQMESRPGLGAVFRIELPLVTPPATSPNARATASLPSTEGKAILVVDDEPEVAATLAEMLADDGHRVETAPDGDIALRKLEERRFDLVLSDVRMPGLDGPGLYRALERRHPHLVRRFVFFTGDALSLETRQLVEETRILAMSKPFDADAIRQVVRRALSAGEGG